MPEREGKSIAAKRRRVRFAEAPAPAGTISSPVLSAAPVEQRSEDDQWESTPADASKASLLSDPSVNVAVTAFNLKKELREGTLDGEDGILPNELVEEDGSSSSGDEIIPKPKRRRISENDDDDDDDKEEENDTFNLSDAIVSVVSSLKPGQSCSGMQTSAARVLATSNLTDLSRENLLALVSKWSLSWGAPGANAHGPFSTTEMLTWARARYFCQPTRMGFVRPFGGSKWARACDVFEFNPSE